MICFFVVLVLLYLLVVWRSAKKKAILRENSSVGKRFVGPNLLYVSAVRS